MDSGKSRNEVCRTPYRKAVNATLASHLTCRAGRHDAQIDQDMCNFILYWRKKPHVSLSKRVGTYNANGRTTPRPQQRPICGGLVTYNLKRAA
ncbi:hypothetical protein E4U54_006579 [Claviceps lovelessii]|nr:hypothetical protein E4U54_006579 [Claviceps lovelessii]